MQATAAKTRAYAPHCDTRVLHGPGECPHCDEYPDWQELRQMWHIAFTGHTTSDGGLPCPADNARPPGSPSDHRHWAGNRAPGQEPLFFLSDEERDSYAEAAEACLRTERELRG